MKSFKSRINPNLVKLTLLLLIPKMKVDLVSFF